MNIKEWRKACEEGCAPRRYENASREIQLSLKYNPDPNATVRHHLRDTEEQRKYNDEHYELWGFEIDENGNEHFEYGKYIIFVTHEEHRKIHDVSGKNNPMYDIHLYGELNGMYGKHHTNETRKKMSASRIGSKNPMYGKKGELAPCYGRCGELHPMYGRTGEKSPMYGKRHTEEAKKKISEAVSSAWADEEYRRKHTEAQKAYWTDERCKEMSETLKEYFKEHPASEELRKKRSENAKGEKNPMYGKHCSEETKERIRLGQKKTNNAYKFLYGIYTSNGGKLNKSLFRKAIKSGDITFTIVPITVLTH